MRKVFLLFILSSFQLIAQNDSLSWKKGFEKEIGVNEIWTNDVIGNLYITRKNIIEKYDSTGRLLFSQSIRSIGKIKEMAPINAMKLAVFSEDQQSLCILDNTLSLSEKCSDLSDFDIELGVHFAVSAQTDRIWVLDQPNSRLLLVSLGRTATSQEVKNLKGVLEINDVLDITEYNNDLYLTDRGKGVFRFDRYGSFIDLYSTEDCEHVSVVDGNMLTLCSGQITITELQSGKKVTLPVPIDGIKSFRNYGNSFWFRTENKVINYHLSFTE